jgi:tryptophan synthase beta subunit
MHFVPSGLHYPGVGPELSSWKESGEQGLHPVKQSSGPPWAHHHPPGHRQEQQMHHLGPTIVRTFQTVIGTETRVQFGAVNAGRLPDALVSCVGGGSNVRTIVGYGCGPNAEPITKCLVFNSLAQTLKASLWARELKTRHFVIGSAFGPHPYPTIVRTFQTVIGTETRVQFNKMPRLQLPRPDTEGLINCVAECTLFPAAQHINSLELRLGFSSVR